LGYTPPAATPIPGSAGLIILANGYKVRMDAADTPTLTCKTNNINQQMSFQMKSHELFNYLDLRVTADNSDGAYGAFAYSVGPAIYNW
jgi:hypothetical protein